MEDDLSLGDGHIILYTDHVSWRSTLEIYIILLTNVTPINLNKKIKVIARLYTCINSSLNLFTKDKIACIFLIEKMHYTPIIKNLKQLGYHVTEINIFRLLYMVISLKSGFFNCFSVAQFIITYMRYIKILTK